MEMTKSQYDFQVNWEPFLLRPNMPEEGIAKPPNTPDNPRVNPRLKAAGADVGIDFSGKTDTAPNTVACHALSEYAKEKDLNLQNNLQEILFQAYFTDGVCPNAQHLVGLGQKVGLSEQEVTQVVNNQDRLKVTKEKALMWSRQGVSGVPAFFINGQFAFSGAQNPESFVTAFQRMAGK